MFSTRRVLFTTDSHAGLTLCPESVSSSTTQKRVLVRKKMARCWQKWTYKQNQKSRGLALQRGLGGLDWTLPPIPAGDIGIADGLCRGEEVCFGPKTGHGKGTSFCYGKADELSEEGADGSSQSVNHETVKEICLRVT